MSYNYHYRSNVVRQLMEHDCVELGSYEPILDYFVSYWEDNTWSEVADASDYIFDLLQVFPQVTVTDNFRDWEMLLFDVTDFCLCDPSWNVYEDLYLDYVWHDIGKSIRRHQRKVRSLVVSDDIFKVYLGLFKFAVDSEVLIYTSAESAAHAIDVLAHKVNTKDTYRLKYKVMADIYDKWASQAVTFGADKSLYDLGTDQLRLYYSYLNVYRRSRLTKDVKNRIAGN